MFLGQGDAVRTARGHAHDVHVLLLVEGDAHRLAEGPVIVDHERRDPLFGAPHGTGMIGATRNGIEHVR